MKKVLLLCVASQTVINFRVGLIKVLQEHGCAVSVVAFDDAYKQEIIDLGVDFYCLNEKNRSLNIIKFFALKNKYKAIIQKLQPNLVFTFMLKPNTFGVLAAKSAGITNIYSMVEGIGDVFIHNSFKWKLVRFVVCCLYKRAFKKVRKVFFLNNDDKQEFLERKLVRGEQSEVIHGIGVDLEKFAFKPIKNERSFLMIARMLETKGIYEYCKCARIVKQQYPDAVFNYLGAEGAVALNDIQEYIADGSINYLGTTKDVRPYLEDCSVFVLLSHYREGLPMSIMEAEATGRAIFTSDNVGCRDTVVNGYNGFLVTKKDYQGLADKCVWAIENPEQVSRMGTNARLFAEKEFNADKINQRIYEVVCGV